MANGIMMFPTLKDELKKKICFKPKKYEFYYQKVSGEQEILETESIDSLSSIYLIKDEKGIWNQDEYNIGVRRRAHLETCQCLFGENGIVCKSAIMGVAIVWTSSDSKQRGVIKAGAFDVDTNEKKIEIKADMLFEKAQLRGEVTFTTVLYLAKAGIPEENEKHLANTEGYILGELDSVTIKLDGNGSAFPVFEVAEPGHPLWYVRCDWIDPTTDLFEDSISINLNTVHKNYKYIDRTQKTYNTQLLAEIMAGALTIIIEKVRLEGYLDQIINNKDLETGSIGQAIFYFYETHGWDLSSPEAVSLSARKFFDQRM